MIPVREYITGGKATFTVVSARTGARYTFRVQAPRGRKPDSPLFVKVRGHGENAWNYLGAIFPPQAPATAGRYTSTRKSRIAADAPENRAFGWLWRNADGICGQAEFLPSGQCCCCGRQLTTPESIAAGIGPECSRKNVFASVRSGSGQGAGRSRGGSRTKDGQQFFSFAAA